MKNIKLLLLLLVALTTSANTMFAQEEEKATFSFSGSVDTYFRQNITAPNKPVDGAAPGSSFANMPGFALGMVNLIATGEKGKVGFTADLGFGPRGADAVFLSDGSSSLVNQLYAYWNVSDKVTLTMGNFNTFLGYEVISPTANFNYSTSYMFSNGPFSHTGLKANIALADNFSAMLSVLNPTDYTEFNPFGTYSLGAQLGYSNDAGSAYLNFIYGDQDGTLNERTASMGDASSGATFQVDLTTGWDVADAVFVGVNATYNTTASGEYFDGGTQDMDGDASGFLGSALYLQYAASDVATVGIRGEYFSTYVGDANANVTAITLSGNIGVGPLTLIPEVRFDTASEDIFINTNYEPTGSLASFILAAVYGF